MNVPSSAFSHIDSSLAPKRRQHDHQEYERPGEARSGELAGAWAERRFTTEDENQRFRP
jgi:hypothetical protein